MVTEIFAILLLILLTYNVWKRIRSRQRLPPGPFRWPIVGNLIDLAIADSRYPHLAMAKMSKKYGDIVSFGFGVHDAVVISSYEAMKCILAKEESTGRYAFPFVLDRAFNQPIGLVFADAVETTWQETRRYSAKVLRDFGFGKKQSMETVLNEEVDTLVQAFKDRASETGGIFGSTDFVYSGISVNIVWQFVAGFRFQHCDGMLKKLLKYSESTEKIMAHSNIYNSLPFLRTLFPSWMKYPEHKRMHAEAHELMKELIDGVQKRRVDRGDESAKPENFIEAFLDEIDHNCGDKNGSNIFTEKHLIVILMDLFLAGSDTTGSIINWMILFLTLNPDVQKKIKTELAETVGPNQFISNTLFQQMPFTRATLQEIFRMSPMAPIPPPRATVRDCQYKSYVIPKGNVLMFNLYPILNDKEFWGDPENFRPERFLDDTGNNLVSKYTERVPIFGLGKRMCFGDSLAKDTLMMTMLKLMQAFTFEIISGQEPSADDPVPAMTNTPRPYKLRIIMDS